MGISHEYNYARRRARQRSRYGKLKGAACVAAILLLSLAITAILQTAQEETAPAQPDIQPSGTVEGILAPLPMQPGEGALRPRCWTLARPARARGPTPSAPTTAASSASPPPARWT